MIFFSFANISFYIINFECNCIFCRINRYTFRVYIVCVLFTVTKQNYFFQVFSDLEAKINFIKNVETAESADKHRDIQFLIFISISFATKNIYLF